MDCYKLANLNDFDALGIPRNDYTGNFEGLGSMDYAIFQSISGYGCIFNGEILFPYLNGCNPFVAKKNAAYIDENRDLWVGIL